MATETNSDWLEATVDAVCRNGSFPEHRRRVLAELIQFSVELAREGREGRKVGTLFVVGDVERVLDSSHPLLLDPLLGHAREVRRLERREFRETVKELAQIDGAFVVDNDGTFMSAGRFIDVDLSTASDLPTGLGARHAAGASISRAADAVAVAVSATSTVRVFVQGQLRAELVPEPLLGRPESSFAVEPSEILEFPDAELTIALAGKPV